MPLSVGEKLGPYEILVLVGKGGMGERVEQLIRDLFADYAAKWITLCAI